ncbi:tetratricopeptide repeat protein [Calidifontibacter terrae]
MINEFDRYTYAQRLFQEQKYTAAARELEGVLAETGLNQIAGTGDARQLLARAYFHSAQLGRAEQSARALVAGDPTDAYALMLLGRTLQRAGRGDEGAGFLRQAEAFGVSLETID